MSETHKEKMLRKKQLRADANDNNIRWMLKSYKSKVNGYGESTAAVKRRLAVCAVDLTSHESRSKFGYCYLECAYE